MSDYDQIKYIVSEKMHSFKEEEIIARFYHDTVTEMIRHFDNVKKTNFKPEFSKKIPNNLSKDKVVDIFMKNGFKFVIHRSTLPYENSQVLVFDFSA